MQKLTSMDTPLLEIRLFGSFGASIEGEPLPPLRSRTEKWLLMLLALRPGHALSREWLAATLWPDSEPALGLYNLRRCLTNLRKALGAQADLLLSPTLQTLSLDRARVQVDVADFDAALAVGRIESLERAVTLYGGPLLQECTEEWALTARIEREQAYLAALETLAAHAASHSQPTVAVRYLRLTIAADPLREAAHCALMQALADCGDYAALTQVYRDLRLLLHRELNAAPAAETEALYRRLQMQAKRAILPPAVPAAGPPRRLPVPLTTLIGRETDIADVVGWLQKARLVTLVGSGGVGKTRLAIAAAEVLAPESPDGVWFVELASLADPSLVAQTVARTLGVKEEAGRPLVETLTTALASRSLLLILDNCEHLLDACAALAETLLSRCPALRLLVTSRETLGIVGEHRYLTPSLTLPPLATAERTLRSGEKDISWLMEYGGTRLFVERAMQVQPSFRLTAQNAASVVGVVQALDGIPLAIELAAARVRSLSIMEIQARLTDRFHLLTGGSRTALPRQQTLRALIDWSYDLLTEREKHLLQRLSVFAGGWSLEAAEVVCAEQSRKDLEGIPSEGGDDALIFPVDVLDALAALVDKSLVVYEEVQGEGRYRLLETVRQYAWNRLEEGEKASRYRRRHRDFFLAVAEEAEREIKGPDQAQWLARLEADHDNLHQAIMSCLEEGTLSGLRLGVSLQRFWQIRGHLSEGRECLTALLACLEASAPTKIRADALNAVGRLAYLQSDNIAARLLHEESLEIYKELGERQGIATTLGHMGNVVWRQGDYTPARSLFEESLEIYKELEDGPGVATSFFSLGNLALKQGDYAAARSFYEKCREMFREIGYQYHLALVLMNSGEVARRQDDPAAARSLYEEALEIFRELGDRKGIADAITFLAEEAWYRGDYATTRSLQEESLEIYKDLGDRHAIANAFHSLALVCSAQGDYPTTRSLQQKSMEMYKELGDRPGIANALQSMGDLAFDLNDYVAAHTFYEQSLELFRELGNRHRIANILLDLGDMDRKLGDPASARSRYEESLELLRESGDRRKILHSLMAFASLNASEDRYEQAVRLWGAAQRLREEVSSPLASKDQDEQDREVTDVRDAMSEADFVAAWASGRSMTMEQAIAYALEDAD